MCAHTVRADKLNEVKNTARLLQKLIDSQQWDLISAAKYMGKKDYNDVFEAMATARKYV